MISHPAISLALSAFALLFACDAAAGPSQGVTARAAPASAEEVLRQLASAAPDDCSGPPPSPSSSAAVSQLEIQLLEAAKRQVADRLNSPSPAPVSDAGSRATAALREVEQSSADIDKTWPADARFHFKVLVVPPSVVVEMSYRHYADMAVFGSYDLGKDASADPGTRWREVDAIYPTAHTSEIDLFPLHRGPGGRARFLARVWSSGCAGSIGEAYYGYEWSPDDGQIATEIIKIEGAQGLDEAASVHVGALNTAGKQIQLPYCFFSAVDTWDNPTLCAADSFDLSGDRARFSGRIYNRPDLVTVVMAIQYARARDVVAVRGYCASDAVARKLVGEMPPDLFADMLDTVKTGPGRERVELADGDVRFDLVKRRSGWLIERFRIAAAGP